MDELSRILSSTKTARDRDRLINEIDLVSNALYKEKELPEVLETQISETLWEYIGKAPDITREIISEKLLRLKKALGELSVMTLTLAFDPAESTINKLTSYVRKNLEEKIILEFKLEPNILGGTILEFKGLYRDYTLRTKLDDVFNNRKEEVYRI